MGRKIVVNDVTPVMVSIPVVLAGPALPAPATAAPLQQFVELCHRHFFLVCTLSLLIIGSMGIQVGGHYWANRVADLAAPATAVRNAARSIAGLNTSATNDQLAARLQPITNQPATLNLGTRSVAIDPDTIRSWLKITSSAKASSIHVNPATILASLNQLVGKYTRDPINSVTVTYAGGSSAVIYAGRTGIHLDDSANLSVQANALAKTLLSGKGFNVNAPLVTVPFQAVTPAAYSKLIEVNVNTKEMYLYDNGQLTQQYAISAGKPSTPTPIGEYHIFSKLPVEDMKGINPDGTPYLQPHVHWINYFLPGGYAIHGVYWHPLSWFGANNSSHGCVGLPDDQAHDVYNWAPLGTTVITHY